MYIPIYETKNTKKNTKQQARQGVPLYKFMYCTVKYFILPLLGKNQEKA
jgi:hypothetical protein